MRRAGVPTGMTRSLASLAERLQESVLEGYPEKLKNEFLNPGNLGRIEDPDGYARVTGSCGDTVEIFLSIRDGAIDDVRFMTDGCGPTIACASAITRMAKGRMVEHAARIGAEDVEDYLDGLPDESKHCAKLAAMSLGAALRDAGR